MEHDNDTILLFDGQCNLCNTAVQFVLKHEKDHSLKFAHLQSDFAQSTIPSHLSQIDSMILLEEAQVLIKSDAALTLCKHLKSPYHLLYYLRWIPRVVRDAVYDVIARYRYKLFGVEEQCMLPSNTSSDRFI